MMWKRFFNWQSDWDWAWGPLLPLRPPHDSPIRPQVWVRLFVAFTLLGVLPLGFTAFLCVLPLKMVVRHHQPLPPFVSETITTLKSMVSDPTTQVFLIGLLFSLPPLFFLFCLPYHWAWNRRAARLRVEAAEKDRVAMPEGIWPPAPKN